MPYKSKSGKDIPLCIKLNENHYIHGAQCPCLTCECGCCKVNCGPICDLFAACRPHCKVPCQLILDCEGKLQAFCNGPTLDIGPEIGCKSVGAEVTCGQSSLENLVGVWHCGNKMFPEPIPSILHPCCCFSFAVPIPVGEDNSVSGDNFSVGPPTVVKMKLCRAFCGSCCSTGLLCNPHKSLTACACGACMEPAFGGNLPFWFCNEFQAPYFRLKKDGAIHPS